LNVSYSRMQQLSKVAATKGSPRPSYGQQHVIGAQAVEDGPKTVPIEQIIEKNHGTGKGC